MSKKLKEMQELKEKKYTLSDFDFNYMNDLDVLQNSFNHYFNQLKTNYLQGVALKEGYSLEDQLEFSIDLKSEAKELTVKKVS